MVLEICFEKGVPLETDYSGKVWGRTWRMVLSCKEEGYGVGLWKVIRRGWEAFKARTASNKEACVVNARGC
ncbi:hypothetical protein CK203_011016 [Vitis vinifera]|uniref:Uncharacterized protein n=1 Tax=Vitis vinifera TaxID=29760 RepID=A0A438JIN0_VITVI|nr:hypothetical protein CK203_011016 [Vitis vinifera]